MNKLLSLVIVTCHLLSSGPAWAWPPTYGAEFTFTNTELWVANFGKNNIIRTDANSAAQKAMTKLMKQICATRRDCKIQMRRDSYGTAIARVNYDDGWWFQISLDPSVVEVQTQPTTYDALIKIESRIQNDIFETARKVGLAPDPQTGGGHIHVGETSTVGDDPRLFRNILVDYANHPELATGILEDDWIGAAPLSALDERQRDIFSRIIDRFDRGEITTVRDLAQTINFRVYYDNPHSTSIPAEKYQALNLTRMAEPYKRNSNRTMEFRAIRAQRDARDYLQHVKLLNTRFTRLKSLDGVVPYEPVKPTRDPQQLVDAFHQYVLQTGLDWDEYKGQMPDYLQKLTPTGSGARSIKSVPLPKQNRGGNPCLRQFLF